MNSARVQSNHRRRTATGLIAIVLLTCLALATAPGAGAGTTATVTVSGVVRAAGGSPVVGLTVGIGRGAAEQGRTNTAADGSYSLVVMPGTTEVWIAGNFGDAVSAEPLPPTIFSATTLALTGDRVLDLTLPAVTTVEVHAQDELGAPVPGATWSTAEGVGGLGNVSLAPGLPAAMVFFEPLFPDGSATDADGDLRVVGFAGTYSEVQLRRCCPPPTLRSTEELVIDATSDTSATFTLAPIDAVISGQVTAPTGDPIAVRVLAYRDTDGLYPSFETMSFGLGTYSFVVPPGTYRLAFVAPSLSGLGSRWYHDAATRSVATPITVAAGDDLTGIDQALAATGSMSGRITRSGGLAVAGAQVWAYGTTDGWWGSHVTTTDSSGNYTIAAPPGTYRLVVVPPAGSGLAKRWYLNASSRASATPIVVTVGASQTGLNQQL